MRVQNFSNAKITSIYTSQPLTINSIQTIDIPENQLDKFVNIAAKLGVIETRILGDQNILDLVMKLVQSSLRASQLELSDLTQVICVTQTNQYLIPGFSSLLQNYLQFSEGTRFIDLSQGCAGFVDGVQLAAQLCTQPADKILLITSEVMSSTLDPQDFGNRLLFGDACSVTLIEFDQRAPEILGFMKYDGTGYGGAFLKSNNFNDGANYFSLNGPAVFSLALKAFDDAKIFIKQVGLDFKDLDAIIPHQANTFILEKIAARHLIRDSLVNEIKYTGNTSSNSIPVGMTTHFERTGKKFGKKTLCVGFGNGFSWGAILVDFSNTHFEKT
jgi:3-oxoacyl-[acyl-carrier-protein] synthase-3